MGMMVALRSAQTKSYFKDIIMEMLKKFGVSEVVICSGYFQENLPCDIDAEIPIFIRIEN